MILMNFNTSVHQRWFSTDHMWSNRRKYMLISGENKGCWSKSTYNYTANICLKLLNVSIMTQRYTLKQKAISCSFVNMSQRSSTLNICTLKHVFKKILVPKMLLYCKQADKMHRVLVFSWKWCHANTAKIRL